MPQEIERKFLVTSDDWRRDTKSSHAIQQAYLALTDKASIRIRIVDDTEAFLTIKSAVAGTTRSESEVAVPVADARELLDLCTGHKIEKRRHLVPAGDLQWEIDVFEGVHRGLVIAEIELSDESQSFARPPWLGREVTGDKRFYNASLALASPKIG